MTYPKKLKGKYAIYHHWWGKGDSLVKIISNEMEKCVYFEDEDGKRQIDDLRTLSILPDEFIGMDWGTVRFIIAL